MIYIVPSHTISPSEAMKEFCVSEEFSQTLDSGRYIFVYPYFCLNHPDYIEWDENGKAKLTEYARRHKDECCLTFRQDLPVNYGYREDAPPTFSYTTTVPLLPAPPSFSQMQLNSVDIFKKSYRKPRKLRMF